MCDCRSHPVRERMPGAAVLLIPSANAVVSIRHSAWACHACFLKGQERQTASAQKCELYHVTNPAGVLAATAAQRRRARSRRSARPRAAASAIRRQQPRARGRAAVRPGRRRRARGRRGRRRRPGPRAARRAWGARRSVRRRAVQGVRPGLRRPGSLNVTTAAPPKPKFSIVREDVVLDCWS